MSTRVSTRIVYLNLYLIDQSYGGPEEGGWYYDVGTPLASVPISVESFTVNREGNPPSGDHTQKVLEVPVNDEDSAECDIHDHDKAYRDGYDCNCTPDRYIRYSVKDVETRMSGLRDLFEAEGYRRKALRCILQFDMAQPFPETRPRYE